MNTARFIILEGGEGAGKSTLTQSLAAHFEKAGYPVCKTREPGGSPGAEEVRNVIIGGAADRFVPDTHLALHYAARFDHMTHTVLPALQQGCIVISDRFEVSSYAYQVHAMEASLDLFRALHARTVAMLREAIDAATYVHCDIDAVTGLERVRIQKNLAWSTDDAAAQANRLPDDAYDSLPIAFHEKIRAGMLAAKDHIDPMFRHVHIDAHKPQEEMLQAVLQQIK